MRVLADDLLDIPVPPHLRGFELVDGKLVDVTPVSFAHACLAAEIAAQLRNHAVEHHIPGYVGVEGGFVLRLPRDPERVRGPDVAWVSEANLRQHGGAPARGFLRLVPDLVVEVDSPDRQPRVEQERIQNYLDVGVPLLWVVHTVSRSVTVYRPDGASRELYESDVLDGAEVLPGLRLALGKLFERMPPEE
jgi:Uma2 family endonuclease